jgi:peptide/nickel transport system substrate-binding protein
MRSQNRFAAVVAGMVGAVLVLAGCAAGGGSENSVEGAETLTIGSSVAPQSFDPAKVGDANYVPYAQAAYDSLLRRTPDGEYVAMLAEEWTQSEDRKTVSLTLRDDVTFSDGSKFNAENVKSNMEYFQQANGPLVNELAGLESVNVIDDTHVDLVFSSPNPDIEYALADAAGRMAATDAIGTDSVNTVPVGSGPYIMDEAKTVQGSTYTFTRNDDYWDPELQKYDTIVFKIFPDETGLLNALRSGQVDAGNLSGQDNIAAAEGAGIEILKADDRLAWAGLIVFDRSGKTVPALGDARVRQAIATAMDRPSILDAAFNGNGALTEQIFTPSFEGYDDALNDTYSYDVDAAKALMGEAGFADGFTVQMPLVTGFTTPAIQSAIDTQLGAINITVEWVNASGPSFYGDLLAGKYPMSYMFLGAPTPWAAIQNYVAPSAPWNTDRTTDPALTAMIDSIPVGTDEERATAYADINRYVTENAWYIPWLMLDENFAVNDGVTVELQSGNNVPFIYNYSPSN